MRKAYYILIVVSAIIFIVFCFIKIDKNGDNQINADLLCADSLMFIQPDSSLVILEEIKDISANFDLQNRALYSL